MRRMVNSRGVRFLDRRAAAEQVMDGSTVGAREAVTRTKGGRAPNLQAARRLLGCCPTTRRPA
jgi:hypothetical protein